MKFLPNRLKIKTDIITDEGIDISCELSSRLINVANMKFKDPVSVNIRVRKVDQDYNAFGQIMVTAEMVCSRCLNVIDYTIIKKDYSVYLKKPAEENIDLTESLREDIIVTLPIKVICQDGCKGLCNKCGQNLNEKSCCCQKESYNVYFADLDKLIERKSNKENK